MLRSGLTPGYVRTVRLDLMLREIKYHSRDHVTAVRLHQLRTEMSLVRDIFFSPVVQYRDSHAGDGEKNENGAHSSEIMLDHEFILLFLLQILVTKQGTAA
jgi:hypothetical protein